MTNAIADTLDSIATELHEWFASVATLSGNAFGWDRDRIGDAAVHHVLRRQADRLRSSRLADDGDSYTPLCLFLAAACRVLSLPLSERHWLAALRNVIEQEHAAGGEALGVALGTPAQRFKMLLDDAIDAAGLGSQVTILDEGNRRLALGLSVNWGIRTLLAYATEAKIAKSRASPPTRDLSWVRAKVRSAAASLSRD
jgi:hypothetical protein